MLAQITGLGDEMNKINNLTQQAGLLYNTIINAEEKLQEVGFTASIPIDSRIEAANQISREFGYNGVTNMIAYLRYVSKASFQYISNAQEILDTERDKIEKVAQVIRQHHQTKLLNQQG